MSKLGAALPLFDYPFHILIVTELLKEDKKVFENVSTRSNGGGKKICLLMGDIS